VGGCAVVRELKERERGVEDTRYKSTLWCLVLRAWWVVGGGALGTGTGLELGMELGLGLGLGTATNEKSGLGFQDVPLVES
jgi:hypothetical protein